MGFALFRAATMDFFCWPFLQEDAVDCGCDLVSRLVRVESLRGRGRSGFFCCSLPHFVPLLPYWADRSFFFFFRCLTAWFFGASSAPYRWVALSGGQHLAFRGFIWDLF